MTTVSPLVKRMVHFPDHAEVSRQVFREVGDDLPTSVRTHGFIHTAFAKALNPNPNCICNCSLSKTPFHYRTYVDSRAAFVKFAPMTNSLEVSNPRGKWSAAK